MKKIHKRLILYFSILIIIGISTRFSTKENILDVSAISYPEYLVAGGNIIGIKLYTEGVHVVDTDVVETKDGIVAPAVKAGIKSGDFIIKINDKEVNTIEEFISEIKNNEPLKIIYKRKNKTKETMITPELSSKDNTYKVGIWLRDSTAGIGTMTYYNPVNNEFGALGHSINDSDTKKLLNLKNGLIYKAHLTSVTKSQGGVPGELNGNFIGKNNYLGKLTLNTPNGIFGILEKEIPDGKMYKVAKKDEIVTGDAQILCCVENDIVKAYDIKIINVIKNAPLNYEGMIIKIIDEDLLSKTDGILQGMSGSPVLQNGKLVGAITHVFVNDPTRGYAIFIENMLDEANKVK